MRTFGVDYILSLARRSIVEFSTSFTILTVYPNCRKLSEVSLNMFNIKMCGGNFLAFLAPDLSEPQRQDLESSLQSPMFEVSVFLIPLYGAMMNMVKVHDNESTTIHSGSYTDDLRATCRPQPAMGGLSSASKQDP